MTSPMVRPTETAAFAAALRAFGSVRVGLDNLWRLWATSAPRLVGDPTQAAGMAAALTELANQGIVELPRGAWDTSTDPPLPRSITFPAARRPPRTRSWRRFPWRTELGWVASLPALSEPRLHDLIAINDWLARTEGARVATVPVRYRSVEVFGDEKHLDTMARTNLFGPGRLSLDLLACTRIPAPLAAVEIGPGPDVLVVENSDTYWVAVHELGQHDRHPIGAVAWGAGKAFPSQVAALGVDIAGRGPVTGTIWYWGDLDPDGVAIAANSANAAAAAEVAPVRPATLLWAAMAERPVQDAGEIDWSTVYGQDWLGSQLWTELAPVRQAAGRIAQESVSADRILDWAGSASESRG